MPGSSSMPAYPSSRRHASQAADTAPSRLRCGRRVNLAAVVSQDRPSGFSCTREATMADVPMPGSPNKSAVFLIAFFIHFLALQHIRALRTVLGFD